MQMKEGYLATKVRFAIIVNDINNLASKKLRLVAISLHKIPNYKHKVDVKYLPKSVCYDVPMFSQNHVPNIGNSICSPTCITMLLGYKGVDIKTEDEFKNRYVANLVFDYGNNIFGNWVYNTITASKFGINSYIKTVYSWEELKYHLAKKGPVGVSIRGNTGLYNTRGHLLVAIGYVEREGKTFVIVNDPNIDKDRFKNENGDPYYVRYEYSLEIWNEISRNVLYIVE